MKSTFEIPAKTSQFWARDQGGFNKLSAGEKDLFNDI
jgi:hypothetical protein